jgi:hypothetical protein
MSRAGRSSEEKGMDLNEPGPGGKAPQDIDWNALRQAAAFLEKAKLAEWVAIMNDPRRNVWVNFLAGVARGVGMVVGATLMGVILTLMLKRAFQHAGGIPWFGAEIKEVIGFILQTIRERQAAP